MNNALNTTAEQKTCCNQKRTIIQAHQLPLSCPTDEMSLWNAHPKVYLPIEEKGEVECPYCSTIYILAHD